MKAIPAALLLCTIAAAAQAAGHSKKPATAPPASAPGKTAKEQPAATSRSSESKLWKVTVVSAEGYTTHRPNIDPPVSAKGAYNLALELEFTYTGPPDRVTPPVVGAASGDRKFPTLGTITMAGMDTDTSVFAWLLSWDSGDPIERGVATGQKFGPVIFYVGDVPAETKSVTLTFADTPPIPLTVTMRK